jgi:hypothetical protein
MGDFGSATETMRIIDLFALQVFAKNLDRCNFRLLQHYLPEAEVVCYLAALSARNETFSFGKTSHS